MSSLPRKTFCFEPKTMDEAEAMIMVAEALRGSYVLLIDTVGEEVLVWAMPRAEVGYVSHGRSWVHISSA